MLQKRNSIKTLLQIMEYPIFSAQVISVRKGNHQLYKLSSYFFTSFLLRGLSYFVLTRTITPLTTMN